MSSALFHIALSFSSIVPVVDVIWTLWIQRLFPYMNVLIIGIDFFFFWYAAVYYIVSGLQGAELMSTFTKAEVKTLEN